ncbi:MAG: hypothetical protein ACKOQ6_00590 [Bacteroidota bacterium]
MYKNYLLAFLIMSFCCFDAVAQHLYNSDLYDFLDELANSKAIILNTAVKPYSRELITMKLKEADVNRSSLTARQQEQLEFYKKEFIRELPAGTKEESGLEWIGYAYQDESFFLKASPIVGYSVWLNDSGSIYRRWGGAEAFAQKGGFSMSASLRDQHESKRLTSPITPDADYLNQFPTSNYKPDSKGGGDYDESRGHVAYTWKWGRVGVAMDQIAWGDNYNGSNIISGRAPVYPSLQLHLQPVRWLDFHYFHAWLKSDVVDSARIYSNGPTSRLVMRPKYMASNLFTFTPVKYLQFSVGNSVVYSDENVNPAYLIPFLYYKAVDRSLNGYSNLGNQLGENSQLFFNVSSRNIRNVHLYASMFVDEVALGDIWEKKRQSNFISLKVGGRLSNLLLDDLFLTAEVTATRPVTYRHYIETADFTSSSYRLGHYLGDNSAEVYLSAAYKPTAKLWLEASYTAARKGEEYPYTGQSGTAGSGKGLPFIEEVLWSTSDLQVRVRYQPVYGAWLFAGLALTDHSGTMDSVYSMPNFQGRLTTAQAGVNVGF